MSAWASWIAANGSTWYQAGVEARRRLAAAGFDVTLGDSWIVNEFSSAVRNGTGVARASADAFVHGLYDGDGTAPSAKGGVFVVGLAQSTPDLSVYKANLEAWLQDSAFWTDMNRYVSDWSQELYGDFHNYGVAGAPPATRRDYLNDYFQHGLVNANLAPDAGTAARTFLQAAYSPLANAAWQWDYAYGWTLVSADRMKNYVSAETYALRYFSETTVQAQDHWGFAWAPKNTSSMPATDFDAQTGAILDRLAASIHDSAQPLDPSNPGVGACGPLAQNVWCGGDIASAWFNDGWKTFTYWGQLSLTFVTPPQSLAAGGASGPIAVQLESSGTAHGATSETTLSLSSSSPQGVFSTSPTGPWTTTLAVTIPAGSSTTPSFYYRDTTAGNPTLSASATGTGGGSQTEAVNPGALATVTVSPSSASVAARRSRMFTAAGADAYGNRVSVAAATWSIKPTTLGALAPTSGRATTFRAGSSAGSGSIVATVGGISGSAPVHVVAAICRVPSLKERTLPAAKGMLRRAHCTLGSVRYAGSRRVRKGRVIDQQPKPKTRLPNHGRVGLTISRGFRR